MNDTCRTHYAQGPSDSPKVLEAHGGRHPLVFIPRSTRGSLSLFSVAFRSRRSLLARVAHLLAVQLRVTHDFSLPHGQLRVASHAFFSRVPEKVRQPRFVGAPASPGAPSPLAPLPHLPHAGEGFPSWTNMVSATNVSFLPPAGVCGRRVGDEGSSGKPHLDTSHRRVSDASGRERRERNANGSDVAVS